MCIFYFPNRETLDRNVNSANMCGDYVRDYVKLEIDLQEQTYLKAIQMPKSLTTLNSIIAYFYILNCT